MLIDVNTFVGTYPFRKLKRHTASELVSLLDRFGIDQACVGSASGIYYHDVMDGNYDLLEEIKPYQNRLIPFAVINPTYAQATEDFCKCIDELGFKGVRIYPNQHSYRLTDPKCLAFLRLCGEKQIPVQIQLQIEDLRQAHMLESAVMISADEIAQAAQAAPQTNLILSNAYLHMYAPVLAPIDRERKGKIYYDLGRIDNLFQTSFQTVLNTVGVSQIVFGSGAPMQYIGVNVLKVKFLKETDGLTDAALEQITAGNLQTLRR